MSFPLPYYSPLCARDRVLYLEYLAACRDAYDKYVGDQCEGEGRSVRVCRVEHRTAARVGLVACERGVGLDGSRAVCDVSERGDRDVCDGGAGGAVDVNGIVGSRGASDLGEVGSGRCRGGEGVVEASVAVRGDSAGVSGRGVRAPAERGPNWARNHAARERRKKKKRGVREGGAVPEWRRGAGPLRGGYFSELEEGVQKELRESRAEALIARNRREAREHAARLAKLESPEAVFYRAMAMLELAEKAAKKANDSKVAGWVATIASSHSESIARSGGYTGVESFDSKTSFDSAGSAVRGRKVSAKWRLGVVRASGAEAAALLCGVMTGAELEAARQKEKRYLEAYDFISGAYSRNVGPYERDEIAQAGLQSENVCW